MVVPAFTESIARMFAIVIVITMSVAVSPRSFGMLVLQG
jgi:hypothetical protein